MKKVYAGLLVLMLLFLVGCTATSPINFVMKKGSLNFKMDLTPLAVSVSKVTITANNVGWGNKTQDLTLDGKMAMGNMTLNEGSWHVTVEVFDPASSIICSSERELMVMAGVTQNCIFSFDLTSAPNEGDVDFQIVINDFAQHTLIPQHADIVLSNAMADRFFVLDVCKKMVGVYDVMFNQISSFFLPDTPNCMAITNDGNFLFFGFQSGHLCKMSTTNGQLISFPPLPGPVDDIVFTGPNSMLVRTFNGMEDIFFLMDPNGMCFTSTNLMLNGTTPGKMVYNNYANCVYFVTRTPMGPTSYYALHVDSVTNMLGTFKKVDAITPDLGDPLRFIRGDYFMTTSSGNILHCDTSDMNNLIFSGNIGYEYTDLCQSMDTIYLIKNHVGAPTQSDPVQLVVMDANTLFTWKTISMQGEPKQIFNHMNSELIFLVFNEGNWYFHKRMLPL